MADVVVIATSELGDRSYVAHDGDSAIVVDPQRDVDRVQAVLAEHGVTCVLVLDTHIHNDYVSGGLALARLTGARYAVSAHDAVGFNRVAVHDGDELVVGTMTVQVLATPGHTDTHLAYVIRDADAGDGAEAPAVFTGGSLLFGSVGRTDLVSAARTTEMTHAQYRSAKRLGELPPATRVFPTHGFGSFCSAGAATGGDDSTIGVERTTNDALTADDEDTFVDTLIAGLSEYPAYYAHMGARNRAGADEPDLSEPEPVDTAELRKRIAAGDWVVDLRDRTLFAAEHIGGTIGIPLGDQFSTYLGWLIPWGTPVTLVGESAEQVATAQRQLVRIGIERPAGAAAGDIAALAGDDGVRDYPRVRFADVPASGSLEPGNVILDVRRDDERVVSAIPGSLHIPLQSLIARLGELPEDRLWVHCASGFRASIAASLLDRANRHVVYIDDDFSAAEEVGLVKNGPHR